ncbi:hypothetical protein [Streptomyces sp. NPDC001536]|uniref:hypothetical protein n=1 Tax=Streptomyces sp. NPDC001536 TaxID=3364583 RepID=UPI003693D542
MNPVPHCGISCPTTWVPLPIEPSDDVASWSKSTAAELWERSKAAGYDLDRRTLRKDLRDWAKDSRGREPFYAFAFYPDGLDTALGLLEVDLINPDELAPPQISRTDLPAGPAVRIRQNFVAEGSPRRGPGILLQTVTYGILPTGSESAVVLLMSWTAPGLDEEMEAAANRIVQTVTWTLEVSSDDVSLPSA